MSTSKPLPPLLIPSRRSSLPPGFGETAALPPVFPTRRSSLPAARHEEAGPPSPTRSRASTTQSLGSLASDILAVSSHGPSRPGSPRLSLASGSTSQPSFYSSPSYFTVGSAGDLSSPPAVQSPLSYDAPPWPEAAAPSPRPKLRFALPWPRRQPPVAGPQPSGWARLKQRWLGFWHHARHRWQTAMHAPRRQAMPAGAMPGATAPVRPPAVHLPPSERRPAYKSESLPLPSRVRVCLPARRATL